MERIRSDEQREHPRFQVKDKTSFVLNPDWPTMGEVVDISCGGLAFNYLSEDEWPRAEGIGSVIFGNHDSCLTDLPLHVVDDFPVADIAVSPDKKHRRCCLQFGDLTKDQKFLLECFIWINGVCEC
jgi:hypothetical protein